MANEMYETELADDVADLPADIDALEDELATSAEQNFQLWDDVLGAPSVLGSNSHPIATTWEGEVQQLRHWATERAEHLESTYTSEMPLV